MLCLGRLLQSCSASAGQLHETTPYSAVVTLALQPPVVKHVLLGKPATHGDHEVACTFAIG